MIWDVGSNTTTVVDGATQYLIRQGVKKLVLDQSNVPGTGYIERGFLLIARDAAYLAG